MDYYTTIPLHFQIQEHFHENPPSNAVIISVVGHFQGSGSVLTHRNSCRPAQRNSNLLLPLTNY